MLKMFRAMAVISEMIIIRRRKILLLMYSNRLLKINENSTCRTHYIYYRTYMKKQDNKEKQKGIVVNKWQDNITGKQ